MRALAIITALSLSGCTLVGASLGAGAAMRMDRHTQLRLQAGERYDDDDGHSAVLPGVMTGAGLGLILDLLIVGMMTSTR
jgi:hypothetical protein